MKDIMIITELGNKMLIAPIELTKEEDNENNHPHEVTEEGKVIFTADTYNKCFAFLLRYQHNSVTHALKYEGFKINKL